MAYKIRHKGKPKEPFLARSLQGPLVQVLVIVALLIAAVVLPRPPEGKIDVVSLVALAAAAAGGVLIGLVRLAQALLGRRADGPRALAVARLLYRTAFVLIVSGLASAFYRRLFH